MQGQYYLHTNGELIYKPNGGVERDSDFVVRVWVEADIGQTPQAFTRFLREARESGAKTERINELANKNKLELFVPSWREQVFGEA